MKGRCPILVGFCVYWMMGILEFLVKIEDLIGIYRVVSYHGIDHVGNALTKWMFYFFE